MTTATNTTPTIRDLITYVHENPDCGIVMVAAEFGIDKVDAEEILSGVCERSGAGLGHGCVGRGGCG